MIPLETFPPLWSGTKHCIVRGNQARVKNAYVRHPSCTVVVYRHKSASPVHNVLTTLLIHNTAGMHSFKEGDTDRSTLCL